MCGRLCPQEKLCEGACVVGFAIRSDGTSELRVRVFPDQIHIDSHDPRLSAEEIALKVDANPDAVRRLLRMRCGACSGCLRAEEFSLSML